MTTTSATALSRRSFLGLGALTAFASGAALVGCAPQPSTTLAETSIAEEPKNTNWVGEAPQIDDADIVNTLETDVLIVGAGNGGMACAASCVDLGLDFILCEKNAAVEAARGFFGVVNSIGEWHYSSSGFSAMMFEKRSRRPVGPLALVLLCSILCSLLVMYYPRWGWWCRLRTRAGRSACSRLPRLPWLLQAPLCGQQSTSGKVIGPDSSLAPMSPKPRILQGLARVSLLLGVGCLDKPAGSLFAKRKYLFCCWSAIR